MTDTEIQEALRAHLEELLATIPLSYEDGLRVMRTSSDLVAEDTGLAAYHVREWVDEKLAQLEGGRE